jgi:sugar lactone lactonase YvrE
LLIQRYRPSPPNASWRAPPLPRKGGEGIIRALLCALLVSGCAASPQVPPGPPAAWPKAVRDFATPDEAVRVAAQFPNSAGMLRRRLGAAVQAKDPAAAAEALRKLAAMGAVLSEAAQAQVAALLGAEAMVPVAAQFTANSRPVATSRVYASIPARHGLVEGVVWDSGGHRLFATTVVDRALLAVEPGGTRVAASGGLGSLFGGAFDPVRNRLWIASSSVPETPKREPLFIGLLAADPDRPAAARRVPAPAGVTAAPGDVAIARDGTVYASDGLNGALYRCRPGCPALEILLAPGTLFSAQGLVLSPDQKLLYIADRRYGIAALERASGRLFQVGGDEDVMLDGIDGLALHGGDLIATQTAYPPARIVRLRLSPNGLRVERLEVLERAHPEWGEVTLATVAGDRLLYVADAQWDHYGEAGAQSAAMRKPTPIRSLPLR